MIQALRKNVTWRAIPIAGIAAGIVFFLAYILLSPGSLGVDGSLILRYSASLILGGDSLTASGAHIIIVGILVHAVLSILFAGLIALVLHRWGLVVGIVGGAVFGLALYLINLYTLTLLFNWFFAINSRVLLISHILFGAVAGGVYELLDSYDVGVKARENAS